MMSDENGKEKKGPQAKQQALNPAPIYGSCLEDVSETQDKLLLVWKNP